MSRPLPRQPLQGSLEARLEGLLEAIENEKMPDRLLELAVRLQDELAARQKRLNPD